MTELERPGPRRIGLRTVLALTAALGMGAIGILPTSAATSSGTQSMTATTTAGTVAITAPANFSLGTTIAPGSTVSNSALGAVDWTDTMNDTTASSVTLAATDLCPTSCTSSNDVPYTGFTITAGSTISAGSGCSGTNTGSTPTAGAGGTLSGTDTTPGTTYSTAVTLATGSTTTEGCWAQTGNTISVKFPANIASASLTATLQYTVTG